MLPGMPDAFIRIVVRRDGQPSLVCRALVRELAEQIELEGLVYQFTEDRGTYWLYTPRHAVGTHTPGNLTECAGAHEFPCFSTDVPTSPVPESPFTTHLPDHPRLA